MPATEADLLALFAQIDIPFQLFRHPALHTVEESQAARKDMPGGHCKCLFVKDKKKNFGLMVVDENRRVDLKAVADPLGFGRLSFASADYMMELLGVKPGSVTPFALINRPANDEIAFRVILDESMLQNSPLHYHPLHNEATVAISSEDILKFIAHLGHKPIIWSFDRNKPAHS